jgi:hypothetical protein
MENQNQFEKTIELTINQNDQQSETLNQINQLRILLLEIQKKINSALDLLTSQTIKVLPFAWSGVEKEKNIQIIEGVFDGEHMIGPDGKEYLVPPNYASKSKLVEGDILKLTITHSGAFIYKQIAPIARTRVKGKIYRNEKGEYFVRNEENEWKILTASATYFKAEPGDEAVILVPQNTPSRWAALENVFKQH